MRDEYDTRLLLERVCQLQGEIVQLRPLSVSEPSGVMPIHFHSGVCHQPINPMAFRVGQWTPTPWPEVRCFGVSMSRDEVVVICEIDGAVRCDPQEHGPWAEKLVMIEGELFEHTTSEVFSPGKGVYYQPPGHIHEPEFFASARCSITWTRDPNH